MIFAMWTAALVASALVGSFLNVVIYRGPVMWGLVDDQDGTRGNLLGPRSYCPSCKQPIKYYFLIPILGYAALRGKCAACKAPISPRYPLVELAAVAIAGVSILLFGFATPALLSTLLGWTLLVLAVIDLETGYLPDWLTLPLIAFGLAANASSMFVSWQQAIIGSIAGAAAFWALGALWRRWRGVDALGLGDAKLMAALGAWAGATALPAIVFVASVASLVVVFIISRLRGVSVGATDPLPFGPGLCVGGYGVFLLMQAGVAA